MRWCFLCNIMCGCDQKKCYRTWIAVTICSLEFNRHFDCIETVNYSYYEQPHKMCLEKFGIFVCDRAYVSICWEFIWIWMEEINAVKSNLLRHSQSVCRFVCSIWPRISNNILSTFDLCIWIKMYWKSRNTKTTCFCGKYRIKLCKTSHPDVQFFMVLFLLIANQWQRLSHFYCHCNWKFISAVLSMLITRRFFCDWVIRPTTPCCCFFPLVLFPKKHTRTRTTNNGPSTKEEGTNMKAIQGMKTTKCLAFEY